jgi:diacylglycerol kinase family enzyme
MIGLIINPHSRKNKRRRGRVARFQKILGRHGRVVETPSVDAIIPALKSFADEGRRFWVADGGDGALHWVINESVRYFGAARATEIATYMPTGGGSVDFVAKHLGFDIDPHALVTRLVEHVSTGRQVPTRDVPGLWLRGRQVQWGDESVDFRRVGFGTALAGYGANFFGPLYEGGKEYGPARIARLLGAAFGVAALGALFKGPLHVVKPDALRELEHAFLRPLRAAVLLDAAPLRAKDGGAVREHTVVHCASLPLNLADILRVFPRAGNGRMHVHAGNVSPAEMARVLPGIITGKDIDHLLPRAYDGPARTFDVLCEPDQEMTPVIDGELFHRITELHVECGPVFRMAVP